MSDLITSALWNWFLGWPPLAHVALAAGVVLFAWGALNGLITLASKIGGWQGGIGALLAVGALVGALWPRKRAQTHADTEHVPAGRKDSLLSPGRPGRRRTYDPDSNSWK